MKQKPARKRLLRALLTADETAALGGRCVDCRKEFLASDEYLVRNETWAAAGMAGWKSGLLHRACLEKRLSRKVRREELLLWFVRYVGKVAELAVRPETFGRCRRGTST
jgi:hypothetical protein